MCVEGKAVNHGPELLREKDGDLLFNIKQVGNIQPKVDQIKRIYEQRYLSNREDGPQIVSCYGSSESDRRIKTELYRRLCCTRQRMQLVVMAAVLALAGAGQDCSFGCRPTNISIPMEICGSIELVHTTACAGQCYHEDPVYIGYDDWPEQRVCTGEWSYEVKYINRCPVGVTVPVARNCECTACSTGNTYCGRFHGDMTRCLSF